MSWHAPQIGLYTVYSTTNPDHTTRPPSPEWTEEGSLWAAEPSDVLWSTTMGNTVYKNYVVIAHCDQPTR
ncbi:MAG: hypothetical protein IPG71_04570 [bacterium]|nr:hypothetical protein [bacterium]